MQVIEQLGAVLGVSQQALHLWRGPCLAPRQAAAAGSGGLQGGGPQCRLLLLLLLLLPSPADVDVPADADAAAAIACCCAAVSCSCRGLHLHLPCHLGCHSCCSLPLPSSFPSSCCCRRRFLLQS